MRVFLFGGLGMSSSDLSLSLFPSFSAVHEIYAKSCETCNGALMRGREDYVEEFHKLAHKALPKGLDLTVAPL